MAANVDRAIANFCEGAIRVQTHSREQMESFLKALQENDQGLVGKKKEHCEWMIELATKMSDTYARTAEDLSRLQALSHDGKVQELRSLLDLNFFIKENQFEFMRREMERIQKENERLTRENETLRKQYSDQVVTFAQTVIRNLTHAWRVTTPGLNLEGTCINDQCQAHQKRVISRIGSGTFNLGDLVFDATCPCCNRPAAEVTRLVFEKCTYTLDAKGKNKERIQENNVEIADTSEKNIADWLSGTITVTLS